MLKKEPKKQRLAWSISLALGGMTLMTACNPIQDTSQFVKETFNSDDPCSDNARNIGIVVGGIGGGVIGYAISGGDSAIAVTAGAAAGGALGALIGQDIDQRRCELHQIAQKYNVPIVSEEIRSTDVGLETTDQSKNAALGLKISMQDTGNQFRSGSDQLTADAKAYFIDIAKTYAAPIAASEDANMQAQQQAMMQQRQILIIGHTDDTGNSHLNAELAEKRAKVVADLFKQQGIPAKNLHFQGAGETQPIADNRTAEGRAKNRRAEIVELSNRQELIAYLEQRKPVVAYYRPQSVTPPQTESSVTAQKPVAKSPSRQQAVITEKEKASARQEVAATAKAKTQPIDPKWQFGGEPLQHAQVSVDVGEVVSTKDKLSWVPFISSAYAAEHDSIYAASCSADRPRISRGVKSLSTGKELEYTTAQFLPGLNQTAWVGDVGQHRVGLAGIAVVKDGAAPVRNPDVLVYQQTNNTSPLMARLKTEVNAYQGKRGVLYRVFITEGQQSPINCIDLVLPHQAPFNASNGYLIYQNGTQSYAAPFKPHKI